jgi:hypothetical protein
MASYVTPKKNTAFIHYAGLGSKADSTIFQSNPTIAAGDFKVSIDGGALANLATLPAVTPAGSKMVKFSLSAAEMNGDNITIVCSDAAGAEWCDVIINIQTSARQIDDLAFPTTSGRSLDVSATGEAGIDWANIGSPTTAVNLSATNIDVDQVVASVSGAVGSVTGSVGSVAANGITASSIATDALGALELAADAATEIATAVWATATRSLTVLDEDSTTLDLDATIRAAVGLAAANLDTQLADLPTNAELVTSQASADDATLAAIAALNNLSAAQVNAEVDTALADYDGPTNTELATALAAADDAVLAQVALVKAKTDNLPSDPADQSIIIAATDAILTAVGDVPTNAELATALGTADDAMLAALATVDGNVDTLLTRLSEMWALDGLDIANPMTVTPTSREAGAVVQVISGDGETTSTVTRSP